MHQTHVLTRVASAAVEAFRFVDMTGAYAKTAVSAVGISEQRAAKGEAFGAVTSYSAPVEAAEPLAQGDLVKPAVDGSGRAAKGELGNCCGRAMEAASGAGKIIDVRFIDGVVSGAGVPRARRNIATKAWIGSLETDTAASGITMQTIAAMEAHFDAVRIILPHVDGNALAGVKVAVAVGGDYTNKSGAGLTWAAATFAGQPTGALSAGTATRPSYLATDWVPLSSVPRTDGGVLPLLYARAYMAPGANSFTRQYGLWNNLANVADGRVCFNSFQLGVDGVTTPASYNSTQQRDLNGIYIIQYMARGKVQSYVAFGDSIMSGRNGDVSTWGRTFPVLAALQESLAGRPTECAQLGWSGQSSAQTYQRMVDLLPILQPQAAVFQAWCDNGNQATDAWWGSQRYYLNQCIALCNANGAVPIMVTGYPTSSAQGFNAANDSRRKALTDDAIALYSQTSIVCDTLGAAQAPGVFPAAWAPGYTNGPGNATEHPNDAGQAAMASALLASLLALR